MDSLRSSCLRSSACSVEGLMMRRKLLPGGAATHHVRELYIHLFVCMYRYFSKHRRVKNSTVSYDTNRLHLVVKRHCLIYAGVFLAVPTYDSYLVSIKAVQQLSHTWVKKMHDPTNKKATPLRFVPRTRGQPCPPTKGPFLMLPGQGSLQQPLCDKGNKHTK